jgi:hypothetical protein
METNGDCITSAQIRSGWMGGGMRSEIEASSDQVEKIFHAGVTGENRLGNP